MDELSARNLAKHGMRRGAYDGATKRRFVLFASNGDGTETRSEFDTKRERDDYARRKLARARTPETAPTPSGGLAKATAGHSAEPWIADGLLVHTGHGTASAVAQCIKDVLGRDGIPRSQAEANARRIVEKLRGDG